MEKQFHVYVASSYSHVDKKIVKENVKKSMDAVEQIWRYGMIPFITLASHYYNQEHYSHEYEDWMNFDFAWLSKCDALFRLPGYSSGADREEEFAKDNNIPIFYTITSLTEEYKKITKKYNQEYEATVKALTGDGRR